MAENIKTPVMDVPAVASIDEQIKLAELQARQLDLQLKKEELEAKRYEIEERKASISELKAKQAERDLLKKQFEADLRQKSRTFDQGRITDEINQANCNHKKGGLVSPRDMTALHQGGDSDKHSIIRHRMIDGSMWIRCTRCRKSWFPPVKINYYFNDKGKRVAPKDGVFSLAKYQAADAEYKTALKMKTSGTPSGSVVCSFHKWEERDGVGQWVDGTEAYREQIASTNLR